MCIFVGKSKPRDLVMAKLEKKSKENPKLEQRELSDGRISLYLEYYDGRISEPVTDDFGDPVLYKSGEMAGTPKYKVKHIRHKESLNLYILAKPRTPIERQQNKDTLALAEKIRYERQQELLEQNKGYRLKKDSKIDFLVFFQEYIEAYTKKDVRMIQMALQRFKDFLRDTPEYTKYLRGIKPQQIDNEMVEAFTEYLQERSKGEGAKSIYQRFKKVYMLLRRDAVPAHRIGASKLCIYLKGKHIGIDDGDQVPEVDVDFAPDNRIYLLGHHKTDVLSRHPDSLV